MKNKIYISAGVPGSGKTEELLRQAKKWIFLGRKLVLAVPTLKLIDEIVSRCSKLELQCFPICGEATTGRRVQLLEESLQNGRDFIITTHAAIMEIDPKTFGNYIVVFDELPQVVSVECSNVRQADLDSLLVNLAYDNCRLELIAEKKAHALKLHKSYSRASVSSRAGTACSKLEFRIYDCLLHNGCTLVRPYNSRDEYNIATAKVTDFFERIRFANEVHILTATLAGGVFHTIALAKGFRFEPSRFCPPEHAYQSQVTLYPLCTTKWSRAKALTTTNGEMLADHSGKGNQYIDKMIAAAHHNNGSKPMLLFCNHWLKKKTVSQYIDLQVCPGDNRGINAYDTYSAAVLVYSGQPSPHHVPALRLLEENLSIPRGKLLEAWRVTEKLERALQDVTRTAIRKNDNEQSIDLYVQDEEVCTYLIRNCMPNAKVDYSIATPSPVADREPSETAKRDMLARELIDTHHRSGKDKAFIINTLTAAGFAQSTAYKKYKLYTATC
ncbi:DEAD/DEAH box helicase family protein [Stutzerimonas nitrititolerans]|uniref:DEAD/DEAH box helicase family protein n=1 Tax=Stutzerimonas nitrititolerans TaxID=2482751 RepID=UPI002897A20C|nr:hypothetical protein [Stutzerimonas nitrititolerans]